MGRAGLDSETINQCAKRVLASDAFSRSPQARRFLHYVVEKSLDGDFDGLKAYTIGVHALGVSGGRSNPETNARMQAGRVRRLLARFYESEGRDDLVELSLPTGKYVTQFLPRRGPTQSEESLEADGYQPPVLYVEAFENLSTDAEDLPFCRGLSEEMSELLVEMDGLVVSDAEVLASGKAHEYLLTGSISRSATRLRVTCKLRSVEGQQTVWSKHFDTEGSKENFHKLQGRLALAIASQLADPIHGALMLDHRRTQSMAGGYRGVQSFFRFLARPTATLLEEAKTELESSLQVASDQALVHAAYATLMAFRYMWGPAARGANLLSAETHAQSALASDPECSLAHLAKAVVHYHHRERAPAERELSLALECERASVTILALAGNIHALMGNWKRGVELIHAAQQLQPHLSGHLGLGTCLYYFFERSDHVRALAEAQSLGLNETVWGALVETCCLSVLGRSAEARRAAASVVKAVPSFSKKATKHIQDLLFLPELSRALLSAAGEAGLLGQFEKPPESARLSVAPTRAALPAEIRVGILHSLSGPMAISESHLVNAAMLAIDEINVGGGVLGRPVRGIVEDGRSDPEVFAQKATKLIQEDGVASVFGCWMSSSRKAVLPVVEENDSLLWYPVQYEGLEGSRNIIYTGSCLNQQVEPAVRWAFREGRSRCFLVGSDYVYPRTVNRLICSLVEAAKGTVVGECYEKLGGGRFDAVAQEIARCQPDIIYNTLNGADNIAFFQALRKAGVGPEESPVMSFSLSELELSRCGELAQGHWACWSYFQSMSAPENMEIVSRFHRRYGESTVLSDPSMTAYAQLHLWKDVTERAGSLQTSAVLSHLRGSHLSLGGEVLEMQANNHVERRAIIGKIAKNRQFDILWRSNRRIAPQPWLGVEETNLRTRELVLHALRAFPEIADQSSSQAIRSSRK